MGGPSTPSPAAKPVKSPDTPTLIQRGKKLFKESVPVLTTAAESATLSSTPSTSQHQISPTLQSTHLPTETPSMPPTQTSTPFPTETETMYEPPKTLDELVNRINTNKQLADIAACVNTIDHKSLNNLVNYLYWGLSCSKGIKTNVFDFASLSTDAMARLQHANKPNLIYKFAYCVGTNRPDSSEPKFLFDRMPFGLVQHQIEFFSVLNSCQVCKFSYFILKYMWSIYNNYLLEFIIHVVIALLIYWCRLFIQWKYNDK